ncbi:MAG: hypothetical protein H7Z42_11850, partial [Roseiflexaceae bacterium]|nr:hypothetical protein [Roseiflexaceae bacterium]
ARAARGLPSRLLLVEEATPSLAAGALASAAHISELISAAAAEAEQADGRVESVLIVGGHEIVPFDHAPNPASADGDATVPGDARYSAREPGALVAEWPVGRIPGDQGLEASGALLARLIRLATQQHERGRAADLGKTFGYGAAVWRDTTTAIYREISHQPPLLSPPQVAVGLDVALLDQAGAVYCNLHGVRGGPSWYGQAPGADGYLVALRPQDVLQATLDGALVFSEACYGAAIDGDERSSLALAFLSRGAACFVGATAMSYGPASGPLSEADLLAAHFWRAVRQGGTTTGAAFVQARAALLRETLAGQATLDDDDRKTALEFVLYGDPTLRV